MLQKTISGTISITNDCGICERDGNANDYNNTIDLLILYEVLLYLVKI